MHESHTPGAGIAYAAVLGGVFVTALYTFRMIFMTFHGKERFEVHDGGAAWSCGHVGHDGTEMARASMAHDHGTADRRESRPGS